MSRQSVENWERSYRDEEEVDLKGNVGDVEIIEARWCNVKVCALL